MAGIMQTAGGSIAKAGVNQSAYSAVRSRSGNGNGGVNIESAAGAKTSWRANMRKSAASAGHLSAAAIANQLIVMVMCRMSV